MASTTKNKLAFLASVGFLLVVWQVIALAAGSPFIFPGPVTTLRELFYLLGQAEFWPAISTTVLRGLAGFIISCLLGLALGLAGGINRTVFLLLQPIMAVIRSTPVMSVVILAIIWTNSDLVPVMVCLLIAFPILYGNVVEGIRNVDNQLVQMASVYKVRRRRLFFELYLPSMVPFMVAGASNAMGITWKVIIAAEVLCQPLQAVGTQMMWAKMNLDTPRVLAWTVVLVTVSYLFEFAMRSLEQRFKLWR
ncbi:MAG: ABC transporter permease [Methylocystaceae bacterium]